VSECYAEKEETFPCIKIGKYYKINDPLSSLHGKIVRCTDREFGKLHTRTVVNVKTYNGTIARKFACELSDVDDNCMGESFSRLETRHSEDLLDSETSHSAAARELISAHENRVSGYKRHSARQVKKLEASEKVSNILDRMNRQKEELDAVENGTWYRDHWKPNYTKIGVTSAVQAANVVQLITLLVAGGAFIPLSMAVFAAVAFANYKVLESLQNE